MENKIETKEEIVKKFRVARKDLKHFKRVSELQALEISLLRRLIDDVVNHKIDQYDDWIDAYVDIKSSAECRIWQIDKSLSNDVKFDKK